MTTLQTPKLSDFSAEDQATLTRVAKRMGQTPEELLRPGIFGVQAHWPAWLESNFLQNPTSSRRCTGIVSRACCRRSPRKRCTSPCP